MSSAYCFSIVFNRKSSFSKLVDKVLLMRTFPIKYDSETICSRSVHILSPSSGSTPSLLTPVVASNGCLNSGNSRLRSSHGGRKI